MGILEFFRRKLRGTDTSTTASFTHPELGAMHMEGDGTWLAEEVTTELAPEPIEVSLTGDASGPDAAAIAAYEHFRGHPTALREPIQGHLFELYENYFSDREPPVRFSSAPEIWQSVILLSLDITDADNFSATLTFDWQDERDDHIITAYVENGESAGSAIDG